MPRLLRVGFPLVAVIVFGGLVQSQQTPTFRAGTDLLMLDVSVLDGARQPVTGLSAADFAVTIDGQPRPVVAFKAVDMPPPAPLPPNVASWTREIAPDVVTNANPPGRVIAIVIDDQTLGEAGEGPAGFQTARRTALSIVDQLGPNDRAAVVYTKNAHTAQTFTTDRRLLRKAIENSAVFTDPPVDKFPPDEDPMCRCRLCSIESLEDVANSLRSLSEQRKVAFFISAGPLVLVPRPSYGAETGLGVQCNFQRRDAMHDVLRAAHAANVTIQSMDPKGLTTGGRGRAQTRFAPENPTEFSPLEDEAKQRIEFLRMIAESTGGRAVVNNNDPYQQTPSLFAESSSYYLLGVEPPARSADDRFHGVQVRVNRRDVDVRTRNGYYDPREEDRAAVAASLTAGALTPLITDPLPTAGIPLSVAAAPFATPSGLPAVAVVVDLGRSGPSAGSRADAADMVAGLFIPETGDNAGWQQQRLTVSGSQPDARFSSYEALARLSTTPGRYELRVGVKTADGRTSSVYTSVEVPDFNGPLTLSGLMVGAEPSPAVVPPDGLADLLPFVPTARRAFRTGDQAFAFVRIYQRARNFSPTTVTSTVTSTTGQVVTSVEERVRGATASSGSAADYRVGLPLSQLPPGEYLLTIAAAAGNRTAERQLRFTVE